MTPDLDTVAAVLHELAAATDRSPDEVIRDLVTRALRAATEGDPDRPPPARGG